MSTIWNILNPIRTGHVPLAPSGRELFGTVIKSGVNQKTVTVQVDRFFFVPKLNKTFTRPGRFQAHDEEEFCRVGDKVVIRACRPLSKTKRYYVRNVVKMFPREFNTVPETQITKNSS
jgi:small subunit ribosomal protein S17